MFGAINKPNVEQPRSAGVAICHSATDTLYISGNLAQISDKLTYYRFKDKVYERTSGRLFQVSGQHIEELQILSPTHQAYLNFLIDKQGLIASFDELSQLEGKHVNNNTVSKHIGKLKRLLDCEIDNVPRQGYKLQELPTAVDIRGYQQKSKLSSVSLIPVLSALVVILTGILLWQLFEQKADSENFSVRKATMMSGSEYHGTLSPNGRFLAFEHIEGSGQLAHLWLKDLHSGEKVQLTSSGQGNEDEIGSFSRDGSRFLFHRTDSQNRCSVHEIVFDDSSFKTFEQSLLFYCNDGYKSINAEYGKDLNSIFFTDYGEYHQGHEVFRFDRTNGEISRVFSLNNSGQGIYRVYPIGDSDELILLSTDDWTSSRFYRLNLADNKLDLLLNVKSTVKSVGVDRAKKQLYFLGENDTLKHFDINSGQLTSLPLKGRFDGFVSYSPMTKSLTIDGHTERSKKIVKLKNPLKSAGYQEVDEIASSGSDNLPQICGDWVYFFSNRSGTYQLWKKHQQQDQTVLAVEHLFGELPESYALTRSCSKLALVNQKSHLVVWDLDKNLELYRNNDNPFINVGWRDETQLLASRQKDGYRIVLIDMTTLSIEQFDHLPQSKTFHLAAQGEQMWLLGHQDNHLLRFDFDSGEKTDLGYQLPLFRNSAWFNWQNQGIYYYLHNEINPVWHYITLADGSVAQVTLPKSFKNAQFTLTSDNDNYLWIVKSKHPQRDIYQYQLIDN